MDQSYYMEPEESYTWIIVFVVVLAVVGLLLWMYFRGNSVLDPLYTFPASGSGGTESFAATNFSVYTASTPASGMKLTVTAVNANPTGEQFVIDNSAGTGIVTVIGPSATNSKISAKTVAVYIWKSSTSLLRLS